MALKDHKVACVYYHHFSLTNPMGSVSKVFAHFTEEETEVQRG